MREIFITFLFAFSFTSFSQSYHPLLNKDREWKITVSNFDGTQVDHYDWLLSLGDTVTFNSKLYYSVDLDDENNYLFREDTLLRKVFAYSYEFDEEYLVYDFSLEEGDTLENVAVGLNNTLMEDSLYIVYDVDTVIMLDGSERKRIQLLSNYQQNIGSDLTMIEGIGGPRGFFASNSYVFETSWTLDCVQDNDINIYGTCIPFSIHESESYKVDLYPSIVSNQLTVNTKKPVFVQVYNIFGALIYGSKVMQLNHSLDFNYYQSGVYIIKGINANNKPVFVDKVIKS